MLPETVIALLREWWTVRSKRFDADKPPAERWLFPGWKDDRPMSTRQFNRLFHEAVRMAGITKRVTLHTLRHSFTAHLLERGTDIQASNPRQATTPVNTAP